MTKQMREFRAEQAHKAVLRAECARFMERMQEALRTVRETGSPAQASPLDGWQVPAELFD